MRQRAFHIIGMLVLLLGVSACFKDSNFDFKVAGEGTSSYVAPVREPASPDVRNVLIYVAGGFNSLAGYLSEDIADLEAGTLPSRNSPTEPVLLVLSRLPQEPYAPNYSVPTSPVLFRLYADANGAPVRDTIRVWGENTPLSTVENLSNAFEEVSKAFPGNRYGLVFSSHASGWLPPRYYDNPNLFESTAHGAPGRRTSAPLFPPIDRNDPPVKSIGMDNGDPTLELDLEEFAACIPFHLEYILFDACLMGCVEVAYELREVTDLVGFSQTEVLADGFDYKRLSGHLLSRNPNPLAVCEDYFKHYDAQTGTNRSATISVINTREMDTLVEVCSQLFEKYRGMIRVLPGSRVQGYFRFDRHFFYDLKDILVQTGITPEEEALLQSALDKCVVYKANTPTFLSINLKNCCGLSMYLPSMGSNYLDNYYRNHLAWNRSTQLVK